MSRLKESMAFDQVLSEGWGWGAQIEAAEVREEGRVSKRGTNEDEVVVCSMSDGKERRRVGMERASG